MNGNIGIAAALTVILLGLAFLVAVALRRRRAIEMAGYAEVETVDEPLKDLTKALFELAPLEVHRKDDPSDRSWFILVDSGGSEDSGCMILAYPVSHDRWPAVVLVRSGRRVPRIFRNLTGGLFRWSKPMADSEMDGLAGTGWYAYQEPNREVPSVLKERLCEAVKIPRSSGLLGIAVIDSYLAIWSDATRLRTLLATAPLVRGTILDQSQDARSFEIS